LVNGPFDGVQGENTPETSSCGMMNQGPRLRANGIPHAIAIGAYIVKPGRLEAEHGVA
jgi:hypothetical protein